MIDDATVTQLIRAKLPDAEVGVRDLTGTRDHLDVSVRSGVFAGKTVLQQHQMVYAALREALADGRVHAVQLKTEAIERQG